MICAEDTLFVVGDDADDGWEDKLFVIGDAADDGCDVFLELVFCVRRILIS